MAITRILNNQITDSTITAAKIANATLTGGLFAADLTLNSNVTISGNLVVSGTESTVSSTNTFVNDPLIVFNNGYTGSPTYDIGILANRNLQNLDGNNVNAALVWVEADDKFEAIATTETGGTAGAINRTAFVDFQAKEIAGTTITASTNFAGALTGNVTGDVTGDLTGDSAGTHTGAVTGNVTGDVTGDLTGDSAGTHTGAVTGNVTGNVTGDLTGASTGAHNGTVGATTPATIVGTTIGGTVITASTNFAGALTGNVTGNVTGDVTGDLTGDVTGNVTGNLTGASTGAHNGTVGATTPATIVGTTIGGTVITASTNFAGDITGDVTGDVTGNLTGDVTGDVAGDVTSTGTSTFATVDVNGGAIDGTTIGATSASTGAFTTLTSSGGFTGDVTGDVTGDLTGDVTSTGTSTFTTVDINGGAIDGAIIGANSAAAGTFTTINASGAITGDLTGDVTGNADTATALATGRTIAITGDATYTSGSFDGTSNVTGALTLSNSGVTAATIGSSSVIPVLTIDAKGRITNTSTAAVSAAVLAMAGDTGSDNVTVGTDTLTVSGTTNEIETAVTDNTITIGLPDNVTVGGNLTISGDLTVDGTTTTVNTTNIEVEDPLMFLATGNGGADLVDIGFYGLYDSSGSQDLYAGLFRDAGDGKFRLFKDTQTVPTTTVDTAGTGYAVASLVANIEGTTDGAHNGTVGATTAATGAFTTISASGTITGDVTGDLTGNADTATALATGRTIAITGDATYTSGAFDGTGNVTGALTLANTAVSAGSYGDASNAVALTVDSKGRITAVSEVAVAATYNITGDTGSKAIALATETIAYTGGTGVTTAVSNVGDSITFAIGQAVGTTDNVTFGTIGGTVITASTNFAGDITGDLTGGATIGAGKTLDVDGVVDIDASSGNMDGVNIGGTTPGTAAFTTASASGGFTGDLTGTADVATAVTLIASNATDAAHFINFTDTATGNENVRTDTGLTYNPSSGILTTTQVTGDLTGDVTGNADTATAWETARTIALGGDLSGSVSIDGSSNVTLNATIAADSIALGTDTTGAYVQSITNGSFITGGDGGSESAALTLAVDATDANTASKVVARDGSGDFAAGTITATLTGNVTGNITSSGTSAFATATFSGDLTGNSAGAAGNDVTWSGDTKAGLFRVVASATYDTVIIGGDGTSGDLATGATLNIVGTDSVRIPSGTSAQRPGTGAQGMMRYNTTSGNTEIYSGSQWKNLATDFTVITHDSFNGDASTVAFTLSESTTTAGCMVSINGVIQIPTSAYSISGTTLTFTEAPASGDVVDARIITTTSTIEGLSSGNTYMKIDATNTSIDVYTGTASGTITNYWDRDGAYVENKTAISVGTSATNIATFALATYRSAKFIVQSTNGTDYQVDEVLVIHDGTTATMTSYAQTVADGTTAFMTITADIDSGSVRLRGTGGSGTSTVRVAKHYIAV